MAFDTLKQRANKIRREVITMLYEEQKCHLGSNMSVIEILTALYFSVMKENDIFISSKGHCAAALLTILQEKGIIDNARKYFKKHNLISHEVPGVLFSGGSLGQGLSVACGMALADRKRRVFCLLGDGELQEGNVWEAVMFAAHRASIIKNAPARIDNLVAIIDYNGLQAFGATNEVTRIYPITDRFEAFGWNTIETLGHSVDALSKVLDIQPTGKPTVVVCRTIKGKGVPALEDKLESHYNNLTKEQYEESICKISN